MTVHAREGSASARPSRAPGPAPLPLVGGLPHLLRFIRDPLGTAGRLFERYGPLATLVRAPARIMSPRGRFVVFANGPAFATMEIKIALAMMLQRFRLERLGKARVDRRVAITMAPRHGLRMRICKADGAWVAARRALPAVRGDIREIVELDR